MIAPVAPPPQAHAIPQSSMRDIHEIRSSELRFNYSGGIMAAYCGGMFFAAVALLTTANYILGVTALGLGVLPFVVQALR